MAKETSFVTYLVIGVAVYFLFSSGVLGDLFSASDDDADKLYPSTLKTSITLNGLDSLATSATDANVGYYVFTSAGEFLKGGTLSSGTASFEVPTGGNYKIIAFLDGSWIAKELSFSTDGADPTKRAVQTVNMDFVASSTATITKVRDPVDLDANASCGANSICHFDILVSATTARSAVAKPIIVVDLNTTAFIDVVMAGLTEVTCPRRLSPYKASYALYCFEIGKDLVASEGIVAYSGTLEVSSLAPETGAAVNNVSFRVIDKVMYADPDYKKAGYSAFHYGAENPLSQADLGESDTSVATTSTLYFV